MNSNIHYLCLLSDCRYPYLLTEICHFRTELKDFKKTFIKLRLRASYQQPRLEVGQWRTWVSAIRQKRILLNLVSKKAPRQCGFFISFNFYLLSFIFYFFVLAQQDTISLKSSSCLKYMSHFSFCRDIHLKQRRCHYHLCHSRQHYAVQHLDVH